MNIEFNVGRSYFIVSIVVLILLRVLETKEGCNAQSTNRYTLGWMPNIRNYSTLSPVFLIDLNRSSNCAPNS